MRVTSRERGRINIYIVHKRDNERGILTIEREQDKDNKAEREK